MARLGVDGSPYFFFVRCLESSPAPSQTGQTFPSLRPVPRQRAHRTKPVSFEFGMYEGVRAQCNT